MKLHRILTDLTEKIKEDTLGLKPEEASAEAVKALIRKFVVTRLDNSEEDELVKRCFELDGPSVRLTANSASISFPPWIFDYLNGIKTINRICEELGIKAKAITSIEVRFEVKV